MKKSLFIAGILVLITVFSANFSFSQVATQRAQSKVKPAQGPKISSSQRIEPYDFIISVPVELHKIPADISCFTIEAAVYSKQPTVMNDGGKVPYPGSRVGYGSTHPQCIPIVNGEYSGTIVVKFNGGEMGSKPEQAIVYHAYILFRGKATGNTVYMNAASPYPPDTSKPNVQAVWGNIPKKP